MRNTEPDRLLRCSKVLSLWLEKIEVGFRAWQNFISEIDITPPPHPSTQIHLEVRFLHDHTFCNMPYFPTAQAWLEQSRLLLAARPTTVGYAPLPTPRSNSADSR